MSLGKTYMATIERIEGLAKLGLYEGVVIESGHSGMIFKRTGFGVDFIIPAPSVTDNITPSVTGNLIMDADYCYWTIYLNLK